MIRISMLSWCPFVNGGGGKCLLTDVDLVASNCVGFGPGCGTGRHGLNLRRGDIIMGISIQDKLGSKLCPVFLIFSSNATRRSWPT